jgi:hypothetical protein
MGGMIAKEKAKGKLNMATIHLSVIGTMSIILCFMAFMARVRNADDQ